MTRSHRPIRMALSCLIFSWALCACSPVLDWRDVRPPASGIHALFPCKPSVEARSVSLGGAAVSMSMYACQAGGSTFALAFADLGDPSRVEGALSALSLAQIQNMQASALVLGPMQVKGVPLHPQALRQRLVGKLPDGKPVQQEIGLFANGSWVFQAIVMSSHPDTEAVATFFESLGSRE